ncbi:hypothetical protein OHU25_29050 [Streptomyces sp. NBC_00117]|uniref:hypothetical protein n=1 Tax=Streptomyces sp. NBC_00117 TaxID=2975657 RepID=UPI00324B10EE
MTEISTEPVAQPATATLENTPEPSPAVPASPDESQVDHNEGGWPVVPLALSGANTTVSMVAAAGLAGGPVAAIVAATGAAVLGTVATYRSRNPRPKQAARRTAARNASRAASRTGSGRGTAGGSRGSGRAGGAGRVPNQKRGASGTGRGAAGGSKRRHGAGRGQGPASLNKAAGLKNGRGAGGLLGKTSQVKALRKAQKEAGGSRGGKRAQTTAARRAVADARRNTKSPKHNSKKASGGAQSRTGKGKGRGPGGLAGRFMGGAGRKARAVRDKAIAKNRARRDAKAARKVAGQRSTVRKAPARKAARRALRRSLARFQGRRLLAALLVLPFGLLGLITSPIGRRLNIPWLIHPGRRLYRRLVGVARDQRAERDEAIREELEEREAAADAEATQDGSEGVVDNVLRPAGPVPTSTNTTVSEGENVSINTGFNFEEHAMEMAAAANTYEPDGCMEILAMVEGLPGALTFVATVMKFLAERSDSEFPLEKAVADGFNDIYAALMSAVSSAEDMGPTFRKVHAQDIARHEDPRNGTEAEKGWNV